MGVTNAKAGMKLNGIIESYIAGPGGMNAGDFAKYVNEGHGTDTAINTSAAHTGNAISAVALDSTHVFIAHSYNSSYYLYGIVCTISGTTITVGTDTAINSSVNSGSAISAVALDSTHVFIAHSYNSSKYYLYGIVCTISGTTITVGTDTAINSSAHSGSAISAVALNASDVIIYHHAPSSTATLYYVDVSISGTTIAVGTDTQLVSDSYSGAYISAIPADSFGTIFVAHSYSSSYYLYAIAKPYDSVVTVSSSSDTILGVSKQTKAEGEAVNIVVPDV